MVVHEQNSMFQWKNLIYIKWRPLKLDTIYYVCLSMKCSSKFKYFDEVLTIVRVFSVCQAQGVTPIKRSAIDYLTKNGIEQMNKVPGKIEI